MRLPSRLTQLLRVLGPPGAYGGAGRDAISERTLSRIVDLAHRQRVLPTIGARLLERGADPLPPQLATFLTRQNALLSPSSIALVAHARNGERNADLLGQLALIAETLARAGIQTIPLKGGALLEDDPGLPRELTDLDVLVCDPRLAERARDLLLEAGYRDVTDAEFAHDDPLLPDHHQLRPLVLDGHAGSVELHRSVLQTEYDALLSAKDLVENLVDRAGRGRMSAFALALHSILHNRVVDNSYRRLDPGLRSVLDVVQCLRRDRSVQIALIRHADLNPGLVRRSIRASLLLCRLLAPELALPAPGPAARLWWLRVRAVHSVPWLRAPLAGLAFIPFALRRERMEARVGHPLGWWGLLWSRLRFLCRRSATYAREHP